MKLLLLTIIYLIGVSLAASDDDDVEYEYVLDSMIRKQSIKVDENYEPVSERKNKNKKDDEIIDKPAKGCRADMPTLSVYDTKIDSNSKWINFKKKNKLFILGISDSKCYTCC
jgi:hypothetical protein